MARIGGKWGEKQSRGRSSPQAGLCYESVRGKGECGWRGNRRLASLIPSPGRCSPRHRTRQLSTGDSLKKGEGREKLQEERNRTAEIKRRGREGEMACCVESCNVVLQVNYYCASAVLVASSSAVQGRSSDRIWTNGTTTRMTPL